MKRRALAKTISVLALVLVVVSSVLAQGPIDQEFLEDMLSDVTADQFEVCYPDDGYCVYASHEDNEDNSGTGVPDDDMGDDGMGGWYSTCSGDATKHPIEFNIVLSAVTYDVDASLALMMSGASDPASIRAVYFNGTRLTNYMTDAFYGYSWWVGRVDPSLVHAGDNLVKVWLQSGTCVEVGTGYLFMYDYDEWPEEEFVPEPGSMILLGSGLAGRAGYATLRWRTRE